jgi:hypothetical protein
MNPSQIINEAIDGVLDPPQAEGEEADVLRIPSRPKPSLTLQTFQDQWQTVLDLDVQCSMAFICPVLRFACRGGQWPRIASPKAASIKGGG